MKIFNIKKTAIEDGIGVRVSVYCTYCPNHCNGCHNQCTWDYDSGYDYNKEVQDNILKLLNHDYIKGITFCGGEPMSLEHDNQKDFLDLAKSVKKLFPNKDIWCWTGYEYEDLLKGGKVHCEVTDEFLSLIDVLVVGPFVLDKRDITDNNRWRGSTNQRVIDMNETRRLGHKVFLKDIPNND